MSPRQTLGTLETVELRKVWPNEATDFNPWLLANSGELSKALGLDLELTQTQYQVGKFLLDLIGTIQGTNDRVIIESQLGTSDHSHFGQLLTYAGGTDANYVIWIAGSFRDEYISAIDWLNSGTTEDMNFFAVEVSAVQIGDSQPAPLFKVVAQPNEWTKETKAITSAAISGERGQLQVDFWTRFLAAVAEERPQWTSSRRGRAQNWFPMSARLPDASYCVAFTGQQLKSELVFQSNDIELNERRFNYLKQYRLEIEEAFGSPLIWHFPDGNKQCIVRFTEPGDFMNQDSWESAIEWFIETQTRLRSTLDDYLQDLKQENSESSTAKKGNR